MEKEKKIRTRNRRKKTTKIIIRKKVKESERK